MILYTSAVFLISGSSGFSSGLELAGIIILCILIIAASYFVTKFIGTKQMVRQKNSNFQIMDVSSIGPGKTLQLVKVGKKYVVIAVSKETISMITELTEDEIIQKQEEVKKSNGFADMISSLMDKKNQKQEDK